MAPKCPQPRIRIADALGKGVIAHPVGYRELFMRHRVVLTHEGERRLILEVCSYSAHGLMCLGK